MLLSFDAGSYLERFVMCTNTQDFIGKCMGAMKPSVHNEHSPINHYTYFMITMQCVPYYGALVCNIRTMCGNRLSMSVIPKADESTSQRSLCK